MSRGSLLVAACVAVVAVLGANVLVGFRHGRETKALTLFHNCHFWTGEVSHPGTEAVLVGGERERETNI